MQEATNDGVPLNGPNTMASSSPSSRAGSATPTDQVEALHGEYMQCFELQCQRLMVPAAPHDGSETASLPASPSWGRVMQLLQVLLAAQEPLPLGLLQRMGLHTVCHDLPLWGLLFCTLGDPPRVHITLKSLSEWLLGPASGRYQVNVAQGHAALGLNCAGQLLHALRLAGDPQSQRVLLHLNLPGMAGTGGGMGPQAAVELLHAEDRGAAQAVGDDGAYGVAAGSADAASASDAPPPPQHLHHDDDHSFNDASLESALSGGDDYSYALQYAVRHLVLGLVQASNDGINADGLIPAPAASSHQDAGTQRGDEVNHPDHDDCEAVTCSRSMGSTYCLPSDSDGDSDSALDLIVCQSAPQAALNALLLSNAFIDAVCRRSPRRVAGLIAELMMTAASPGTNTTGTRTTGTSNTDTRSTGTDVAASALGAYACDRLRWLRWCQHDLNGRPGDALAAGYMAPANSLVFRAQAATLGLPYKRVQMITPHAETLEWSALEMVMQCHCCLSCVAVSPDGSRLASADGGHVCVWDLRTGERLATLEGHTKAITSICFSPDGNTLASGSFDEEMRLWDMHTRYCVAVLQGHSEAVTSVCFSPDGTQLASGSDDATVCIWDVGARECVAMLDDHDDSVNSVCYSSGGERLASAGRDMSVRVWVRDTCTWRCVAVLLGHTDDVRGVCFSPCGALVASCSDDTSVRLWNLDTQQCVATLRGEASGSINSVSISADGGWLAGGCDDGCVRVWDVATEQCVAALQGHSCTVTGVCFCPYGSHLASVSMDTTVRVWNVASAGERATTAAPAPAQQQLQQMHTSGVSSLCFSADGSRLVSGCLDGMVRIWDARTGECLGTLQGHEASVNSICFSPADEAVLASGSDDTTVRVWDVQGEDCIATLEHPSWIFTVCFSPDGRRLASGGGDPSVCVWDVTRGEVVTMLQGHATAIRGVCFSPDGARLASGGEDGTVRVWSMQTFTCIYKLAGHTDCVNCVCMSPDGNCLASGSDDTTVRLWDARTGKCTAVFQGHTQLVISVCFSRESSGLLASASYDKSVRVWDVRAGRSVTTLHGHTHRLNSVCFCPKVGGRLASGSDDKSVRVWDL